MPRNTKLLVLAGDGIGPEVMRQVRRVIDWFAKRRAVGFDVAEGLVGGGSIDKHGVPLTDATMADAMAADAVLLGAVGGPKWDSLPFEIKPERGLLRLRKEMELFANLRPALVFDALVDASSLKPELVSGLDIMILRELTGDIYFGQPRGIRTLENGERQGYDTMHYSESEIRRVAHVGFQSAMRRSRKLCSVDKANVLDTSMFWREIVTDVAKEYPQVELSHMYVDNAAMQLVRAPKQFDVILTGNIFGDILSDEASMLTGSIGMLPSALLDANNKGLYEPCHGSAPDIAGKNIANPLATILSVAMMMRYTFAREDIAQRIEGAVRKVLQQGLRTGDIYEAGMQKVGTDGMGKAVVAAL